MKNKYTLLVVLYCLFAQINNNILAQEYDIEISKITGLNEDIITNVEQDVFGFIWIATKHTVYKYNNTIFLNFSEKKLKLENNSSMIEIIPDANGNIWYYALNNFKIKILNNQENKVLTLKEAFPNLPFSESDIIKKIYRDDTYNLYISIKNKGLYKYDGKKITLVKLINEKNEHPIYFTNTKLYNWFGFNRKIIRQNKENLSEENFTTKNEIKYATIFNQKAIFIQLKVFAEKTHITERIAEHVVNNKVVNSFPNFKFHSKSFNYNKIFQKINDNKYWFNNEDYLTQIDKNKNIIFKIKIADLPFGDRYRAFFIDKNNIMWIITQTSLYKVTFEKNKFKKYLEGYSLKSIFKRDSIHYISVFGNNIKELDSKNKIHPFKDLKTPYSFYGTLYNKDTLWAARYSRILKYNFKTKKKTDYKRGKKIDNEEVAYGAIARHPKTNSIFIGSFPYLTKIDESEKIVRVANHLDKFLEENDRNKINVRSFKTYGDSLWIGTAKGLFLMNHKEQITRAITPKNGLPENLIIQNIFIENGTTFWLGTQGQGLIKWNRVKNSFKTFTTKDGLSNNNIYAIYKDKYDFFWLPTDNGLNRFAPKTLKNQIFLPNKITHKEFNHLSHFQDKDGTLYFGGINGLNVFNPEDFLTHEIKNYNLSLSSIKTTLSDNSIVKNNQIKENYIEINSDIKKTELEFILLDFKNNVPLQYQYKITPLHKDYIVTEDNKIILPKLKNGDYKLHVKSQSSDGNWTKLKEPIIIKNSTINTLFNLYSVLILSLSSIVLFILFRKRKVKLKKLVDTKLKVKTEVNIDEVNTLSKSIEDEWLDSLNTTILENMNSINFGMEFLSDKMILSERQLQRRIKKITNLTPNKHITEIRLIEAFRLIEEKEVKTVKELSEKVGYTTSNYFSKLFKDKYGKKPSEFLNF
jgi:ligand-binding sensor domain-containing protein/AraC-like DNA-binding protein